MRKPTADEVRKANMETLAAAHAVYVESMREFGGREGLANLGEANRIHGKELGEGAIEDGALRKGDLRSIYEFFEAAHPFFGFGLELLDVDEHSLRLKVHSCPWIDTFKSKGAQEDICQWVCKMDEGIGQAVNPDLEMTIPKCMMRGDDYCIYHWEES
ncbi:MAG: L-2-amino-thiazoline-4-carboxylic acid hydrolase [Candidatus Thorarchaeota archaeon]|nr:L-2-amino-thiazoline-4-carboxylic acid hydrolase [Candidatus Thorarchaeota archaeon]